METPDPHEEITLTITRGEIGAILDVLDYAAVNDPENFGDVYRAARQAEQTLEEAVIAANQN